MEPQSQRDAFLAQYHRDLAADHRRSASDYLAQFPGADGLICEELARLLAPEAGGERQNEIGPYTIERELGRGAQGVVYMAHDRRLHRRVALKVLKNLSGESSEIVLRFRREAELASRLDHPGICSVLEMGSSQSTHYLAMRFVEGETLASVLSKQRASNTDLETAHLRISEADSRPEASVASEPPDTDRPKTLHEITEAILIIEKAAHALHHAHTLGIIHRDIKPGNIMIAQSGDPVVLDFGLARETDGESASLTHSGDLFGTPAYMSPEQLLAKRVVLDARTDVYSLGVTLYEAVTLRRPFEAPTREALFHAIQVSEPANPRKHNPNLARDLVTVIQTAIAKDRNRRYQSAQDLAEDLRRVRSREPIKARPQPVWVKAGLWCKRHPGIAAATVAALLSLAGGLIATMNQRDRAELALADWERLADRVRLEELIKEADQELWPIHPSLVNRAESWLARARDLVLRLPVHENSLSQLRALALPYSEKDRAEDQAEHSSRVEAKTLKRSEQIQVARETISQCDDFAKKLSEEIQSLPSDRRPETKASQSRILEARTRAEGRLLDLLAEQRADEQEIPPRRTYRFSDAKLSLQQAELARLIDGLRSLGSDLGPSSPTIPDVDRRRRESSQIVARTLEACKDDWASARGRLKLRAEFSEVDLEPCLGLIPLGKDAHSGLELFYDPTTGSEPTRDENGFVRMDGECGVVFVFLAGGKTRVGTQSDDDGEPLFDDSADIDDREIVSVELDPFFIAMFELTQGQWQRSTGENPSAFYPGKAWRHPGMNPVSWSHPVESITWEEADRALRRLNYTLPTEAQWEYAARGGSPYPYCNGDSPDSTQAVANLSDRSLRTSYEDERWPTETWTDGWVAHAPVGRFEKNRFGLHDVHGNVWEWCRDSYLLSGRQLRAGDGLLVEAPPSDSRAVRGGSYNDLANRARLGNRFGLQASHRQATVGLRPVKLYRPFRKS